MARFHCPQVLVPGALIDLPSGAARHVQVLRLQPGHSVDLFDGQPQEGQWGHYRATITHMGRSQVQAQVGHWQAGPAPLRPAVHLAVGVPTNERMDWLVEKATELGVTRITPLITQRSVLRLDGERAQRRQAHWQAIAVAACEQCGRDHLPTIEPMGSLQDWLARRPSRGVTTAVLSLGEGAQPLADALQVWRATVATAPQARPAPTAWADPDRPMDAVHLLIGPEGGLSPEEDAAARAAGCLPVSLGALTLRTETAALAALALLGASAAASSPLKRVQLRNLG